LHLVGCTFEISSYRSQRPPFPSTLNQMNTFQAIERYLLIIHYSTVLPFASRFSKLSLSIMFYNSNVYAPNASLPFTSLHAPPIQTFLISHP